MHIPFEQVLQFRIPQAKHKVLSLERENPAEQEMHKLLLMHYAQFAIAVPQERHWFCWEFT